MSLNRLGPSDGPSQRLSQAPANFDVDGGRAVFVDVQAVDARVTLDVPSKTSSVKARVEINQSQPGFPIVDLRPGVQKLRVDGKELSPDAYRLVEDPDRESKWRIIGEALKPGRHVVEMEYALPSYPAYEHVDGPSFDEGGANIDLHLHDGWPRNYLERYFPSNGTFDPFPTRLDLQINGASRGHQILTSGQLEQGPDGTSRITFPEYMGASGPFLKLYDPAKYASADDVYEGANAVPIRIVARRDEPQDLISTAMARTKELMRKYEEKFGPYPHASLVIDIGENFPVGLMEYAGGFTTNLESLPHELAHQWFGRGIFPATGRDEWIDEAIVTWIESGEPATPLPEGKPIPPLGSLSPYTRSVNFDAYEWGSAVMADLNAKLASRGGLAPLLREFVTMYARQPVTTEMLEDFLAERTSLPIREYFQQYVYADASVPSHIRSAFDRATTGSSSSGTLVDQGELEAIVAEALSDRDFSYREKDAIATLFNRLPATPEADTYYWEHLQEPYALPMRQRTSEE